MSKIKSAALGFSVFFLAAGGVVLNGGALAQDAATKPVSKHDLALIKGCKEMQHDAMMKNDGCLKMMKLHPELLSPDFNANSH